MYRLRKFKSSRHNNTCKCTHPSITHYTKDGHCVFDGCSCQAYAAAGRPEFTGRRAICNYNHAHDSQLEVRVCADLHYQKITGGIRGYQAQKVYELLGASGGKVGSYKVDFVVDHNDGLIEFIEAKGEHLMRLQPWPLKWALMQDQFKDRAKYKFTVIKR